MGKSKISNLKAYFSAPDNDGAQRVAVKGQLAHSPRSFDVVGLSMIVKNASGLPFLYKTDQFVCSDKSPNVSLRGFTYQPKLSEGSVEVSVTTFQQRAKHLLVGLLEGPGSLCGNGIPCSITQGVDLQGWSVQVGAPDSDGDCTILLQAYLHTELTLGQLQWRVRLVNADDEEVASYQVEIEDVLPGKKVYLTDSNYLPRADAEQKLRVVSHLEVLLPSSHEVQDLSLAADRSNDVINACRDGNLDFLNALIEEGVSVDQVDERGTHGIHWAAQEDHLPVVKRLVASGISIEVLDAKGRSTLSRAALMGHAQLVQYLVEAGADLHAESGNENTALGLAAWNGHTEVVRVLYDAGAGVNPRAVMRAAKSGHISTIRYLCEEAINEDWEETRSQAMATAAMTNQEPIVHYLIESGGAAKFAEYRVGLAMASNEGHLSIVRLLYPLVPPTHQQMARGFALQGEHQEVVDWIDAQPLRSHNEVEDSDG